MSNFKKKSVVFVELKRSGLREVENKRGANVFDLLKQGISTLIQVTVFLSLAAVLVVTALEIIRRPIVFEDFSVPEELRKNGYSGNVVSSRIWDDMRQIQEESSSNLGKKNIVLKARQVDIAEPKSGVSTQKLARLILDALGLEQTKISGEIVCVKIANCAPHEWEIHVRLISGENLKVIKVPPTELSELEYLLDDATEFEHLLDDVALEVMRGIDPYIVAAYLSRNEASVSDAKTIAKSLVYKNGETSHWAANLLGIIEGAKDNKNAEIQWYKQAIKIAHEAGIRDFWIPHSNLAISYTQKIATVPEEEKDYTRVFEHIDAAILSAPTTELAELYLFKGATLAKTGKREEAITFLKKAGGHTSSSPVFPLNLGMAFGTAGEFEEAISILQSVVSTNPQDARAWAEIGVIYTQSRDFDNAIVSFNKSLQFAPNSPVVLKHLGVVLAATNKHEEAINNFRLSSHLKSPDRDTLWLWALSSYEVNNLTEVEVILKDLLKLAPDDKKAIRLLGQTLFDTHNFDQSIKYLTRASDLMPNEPEIWNLLGRAYGSNDEFGKAIEIFTKTTDDWPEFVDGWINLALAFQQENRHSEATVTLRKLVESNPGTAMFVNMLGASLANEGKFEKAVKEFAEAHKLDSELKVVAWNWEKALIELLSNSGIQHCESVMHDVRAFLSELGRIESEQFRNARSEFREKCHG